MDTSTALPNLCPFTGRDLDVVHTTCDELDIDDYEQREVLRANYKQANPGLTLPPGLMRTPVE